MTEWTAGKMFVAAVGAVGAGLLVRKAVGAIRGGSGGANELPVHPSMPSFPTSDESMWDSPPPPPPLSPEVPSGGMTPEQEQRDPGRTPGQAHRGQFDPLVERWRPEVAKRLGTEQHLINAMLTFIKLESGGDMCSVGIPGVEAGIFQLYFPADEKYGATYKGLMEICKKSDRQNPRDISWMSPAELEMEVGSGVRKVMTDIGSVRRIFAANGVTWPESSFDFGAAVKQMHAAPAVMGELLTKITKRDGHPPASWRELHRLVMEIPANQMSGVYPAGHKFAGKPYGLRLLALAPSKHGLKNRLEDTLRNAEHFAPSWAAAFA